MLRWSSYFPNVPVLPPQALISKLVPEHTISSSGVIQVSLQWSVWKGENASCYVTELKLATVQIFATIDQIIIG